jgi:hypothetical protein
MKPILLLLVLCICSAALVSSCHRDWRTYQHDSFRTSNQFFGGSLRDASKVATLHVVWSWHPGLVGDPDVDPQMQVGFSASPVVADDMVFVGHLNGQMYALTKSGTLAWKFPCPATPRPLAGCPGPATGPAKPLTSVGGQDSAYYNPSSPGIASTAAVIRRVQGKTAVIFGAPDPSSDLGDGRVWAVDEKNGAQIWVSDVVAERAENKQIGYDSPLVLGSRVYIGIASYGDNPLIPGGLFSLDLQTGKKVTGFKFFSSKDAQENPFAGGSIWSSPAATPKNNLVITTGNPCRPTTPPYCGSEPAENHAPSMLQLDAGSGSPTWEFHPVPWTNDQDDDWASTPAILNSSCGPVAISHPKDGFVHAIAVDKSGPQVGQAIRLWTYPDTTFDGGAGNEYTLRPPAVWSESGNDVAFTIAGGLDVITNPNGGTHRLYALNVCGGNRVRWWTETGSSKVAFGAPSVTHGIVYIGDDAGVLHVFADTSIRHSNKFHCEYPPATVGGIIDYELCVLLGWGQTEIPVELATVSLKPPGAIYQTPALVPGRVYVTTRAGFVYALEP